VITERFERSVRIVAQVNGIPDYPFVVVAHPIADKNDAALLAMAEAAVPRIVELLTQRKG
jgi:hypothetical protein